MFVAETHVYSKPLTLFLKRNTHSDMNKLASYRRQTALQPV